MAHGLHIQVKCPHCGKSLMTPEPKIDQLDSIQFLVKDRQPDRASLSQPSLWQLRKDI
jgi:hypothetical protein